MDGWPDPRMPTLAAMRRRGYPASAIREFVDTIGVAKTDSFVEVELLEHIVRDQLNNTSPRRMAVLEPLRLVIDNYPDDLVEEFDVPDFPHDPENTTFRKVPFGKLLFIERSDFEESPPPKYFRLSPGREVRLMNAYYVTCTDLIIDELG